MIYIFNTPFPTPRTHREEASIETLRLAANRVGTENWPDILDYLFDTANAQNVPGIHQILPEHLILILARIAANAERT